MSLYIITRRLRTLDLTFNSKPMSFEEAVKRTSIISRTKVPGLVVYIVPAPVCGTCLGTGRYCDYHGVDAPDCPCACDCVDCRY